jgi:uncharacterized protein (DUF58 family)
MLPGPRLLPLLAALLAMAVAASIAPFLVPAFTAASLTAAAVVLTDALLLSLRPGISASRSAPARLALGSASEISITLRNPSKHARRIRLTDGLPDSLPSPHGPWQGTLAPQSHACIAATVTPTSRGPQNIEPAFLEEESPLGLWSRRYRAGETSSLMVYPDYEPVLRFALLAVQHREAQMGIVRRPRHGQSREFRQLRDYQHGDPLNTVDWKATARRNSLTSREFEEQRNQTIILMADCSRRLRALDGQLSQFDHTLNAMLLLSSIALRKGDRVGSMAFGGDDRWLPPVAGPHAMPRLLEQLNSYQSTMAPGDFSEATHRLLQRQPRRALVVFCTNLRSEDLSAILPPLKLLRQRHLVVVASLLENEIAQIPSHPIGSLHDALTLAHTHQTIEARTLALSSLQQHRIITLHTTAQQLPIALANLYLDIKLAGTL